MWEQVSEGDSIDEDQPDHQPKPLPKSESEESDDDIMVKVAPEK
jgi:hypothetical protein